MKAAPTRTGRRWPPLCAGFIGMAGPYDLEAHYGYESRRGVQHISMLAAACEPLAAHSPTALVRRGARLACERALLVHGERDITCPLRESAIFAVALASSGQNVEFVTLRDDAHLTFLVDLMAGRACVELLGHLRRFCAGGAPVARL